MTVQIFEEKQEKSKLPLIQTEDTGHAKSEVANTEEKSKLPPIQTEDTGYAQNEAANVDESSTKAIFKASNTSALKQESLTISEAEEAELKTQVAAGKETANNETIQQITKEDIEAFVDENIAKNIYNAQDRAEIIEDFHELVGPITKENEFILESSEISANAAISTKEQETTPAEAVISAEAQVTINEGKQRLELENSKEPDYQSTEQITAEDVAAFVDHGIATGELKPSERDDFIEIHSENIGPLTEDNAFIKDIPSELTIDVPAAEEQVFESQLGTPQASSEIAENTLQERINQDAEQHKPIDMPELTEEELLAITLKPEENQSPTASAYEDPDAIEYEQQIPTLLNPIQEKTEQDDVFEFTDVGQSTQSAEEKPNEAVTEHIKRVAQEMLASPRTIDDDVTDMITANEHFSEDDRSELTQILKDNPEYTEPDAGTSKGWEDPLAVDRRELAAAEALAEEHKRASLDQTVDEGKDIEHFNTSDLEGMMDAFMNGINGEEAGNETDLTLDSIDVENIPSPIEVDSDEVSASKVPEELVAEAKKDLPTNTRTGGRQ